VAGLAAVWSVASPLSAGCAAATPAAQLGLASSESSQFVTAINQLRESKGLGDLTVDSNLTSIATNWAITMGGQDTIFHRSNLADGVTIDWTRLGENVGVGPTVSDLMSAFIASPHHYENLVDPRFNRIGVGTVRTPDGLMYTAHEFAAVAGGSSVQPASNPAPAPAPVVAAPRTTTPRVTTPHVSAPRTTTPPAPPAPPTTAPPTTAAPAQVVRSVSNDNELHDGSSNDQQKQNNKSDRRCGAQSGHKVVAAGGTTAVDRAA
jgi:hypothetical protein